MASLLSADDLAAMRGGFSRRLMIGLAVAVLLVGVGTLIWTRAHGTTSATNSGVPLTTRVNVSSDTGSSLPNRLTVLFVNGTEVGRTDATGQLRGLLPRNVTSLQDSITIREGEAQVETFPPDPQAVAYTFPGDSRALPFNITGCRLALSKSGAISCTETRAAIPEYGAWLMALFVALILFPTATIATRHVAPWPREWGRPIQQTAAYLTGATLTAIVVIMFSTSGVFDQWMFN